MEKKKLFVSGCCGRMGSMVCKLAKDSEFFELVGGYDISDKSPDNFKVYNSLQNVNLSEVDIFVDFSSPAGALDLLKLAQEANKPAVIATTGFAPHEEDFIRFYAKRIPIFYSANMSYEVLVIRKALQLVAPLLAHDDIEISETHHSRKKDCPSGTAKLLFNTINDSLGGSKTMIYGREGKRENNEIGIASLRGGNVPGTHSIHFFGENEDLTITHQVYSPIIFAEGALKAAEFLVNQPAGLYSMDDLVK